MSYHVHDAVAIEDRMRVKSAENTTKYEQTGMFLHVCFHTKKLYQSTRSLVFSGVQ